MASRFIPPPNRLNQISNKKAKRTFSDDSGQSIFHELKKNIRDKHTADAFESVGAMNAVVLEVIDTPVDNMLWRNPLMSYLRDDKGVLPDYVEVRFRIPELHAHLPEPENAEDWAAINRHPKAVMTKDKSIPEIGDIVVIDFQDKNNFSGASVSATVNSSNPPSGGGVCRTSETFASGAPTLNVAQPEGDAQEATTASEERNLTNAPAEESLSQGIQYEKDPNHTQSGGVASSYLKKIRYLISINEFNTMPEFSDVSLTFDTLMRKEVYDICFTLANNDKKIKDTDRLIKIMIDIKSKGVRTGLMIRQDYSHFKENFLFLTEITQEAHPDYIMNHYTSETKSQAEKVDSMCGQLSTGKGIKQYAYMSHETVTGGQGTSPYAANLQNADKVFASQNHFDYNNKINEIRTPNGEVVDAGKVDGLDRLPAFRLGGVNFLKTKNDPCLFGERSLFIFKDEYRYPPSLGALIDDYKQLKGDLFEHLKNVHEYTDVQKQNFLNSVADVEKRTKAEVRNSSDSTIQPAQTPAPVDNTPSLENAGTAEPSETTPLENNSSPGLQCQPFPGGGLPNPVGNGELVQPPTRRFSDIPNYQDLGWTTDPGKPVTNVILNFMNRFATAYYRRIPMNDPINTGSSFKKLRVTSTLRTAGTQVYLMWDKMDKGGENAVWSLYGTRRQWVKDVVAEWKRHKAGDAGANARAVASVQADIDAKAARGGRGHAQGSAVDIHTWSHLKAEGQPYDGASESQMNNTRFIRAVVDAAIEAGGKPIVEAYQQHVHITIL